MGNGVRKVGQNFNAVNNAPGNRKSKKQSGQLPLLVHTLSASSITVIGKPPCVLTAKEKDEVRNAWKSVDHKTKLGNLILTRIFRAEPRAKRLFHLEKFENYALTNHKRFLNTAQQLASFLDTVVKSLADGHEQMTATMVKCCRTFGSKHVKEYENTESVGVQYWRRLPETSAEALEEIAKSSDLEGMYRMAAVDRAKTVWIKFVNGLTPYLVNAYYESKERARRLSSNTL